MDQDLKFKDLSSDVDIALVSYWQWKLCQPQLHNLLNIFFLKIQEGCVIENIIQGVS